MKLLFVVSNFYPKYSEVLLRNSLLELFKNNDDLNYDEKIINTAIKRAATMGMSYFKIEKFSEDNIPFEISIISIIGALEIPQAISFFLEENNPDGVIALGIIKKGATQHDEYVTTQAMNGISALAISHIMPITTGIITAHTEELIQERVDLQRYNVGGNAVKTCLHLINLKNKIKTFK